MYSFMGGGLFCAIVGNILLVVSTATDYWMQYRLSGSFAHQGLWRYCMSGKCYMQTDSIGKWSNTFLVPPRLHVLGVTIVFQVTLAGSGGDTVTPISYFSTLRLLLVMKSALLMQFITIVIIIIIMLYAIC